jgi:hypothetical protein
MSAIASIGGFAITGVVVQYLFGGSLFGCPTWAWALTTGVGLGLACLPASLIRHWRQWQGL